MLKFVCTPIYYAIQMIEKNLKKVQKFWSYLLKKYDFIFLNRK